MTPAEELTALESAYAALLSGGVQSYSINGRSLSRLDARWMAERMDQLRFLVARESNGGSPFLASRFIRP